MELRTEMVMGTGMATVIAEVMDLVMASVSEMARVTTMAMRILRVISPLTWS
jgi:hypothetical protein